MLDEKLFRDVIMNISQNSLAAIKTRFPGDTGGMLNICTCENENKYIIKMYLSKYKKI